MIRQQALVATQAHLEGKVADWMEHKYDFSWYNAP